MADPIANVSPPRSPVWIHPVAGAGLGLCVGVLMGLTTTPVIGTVIGALAALFATVFGVRQEDSNGFLRIGAFGAFCVVGVLMGVVLRTHNVLGTSVGQELSQWTNAGYDTAVARRIVLYKELGIAADSTGRLMETSRTQKVPGPTSETTLSAISAATCDLMAPNQFANDGAKIARSYRAAGGDWANVARAADSVPPAKQFRILSAAWSLACNRGE